MTAEQNFYRNQEALCFWLDDIYQQNKDQANAKNGVFSL